MTDFVLNKVPRRLTVNKFQKMFKKTAKRLLLKLYAKNIFVVSY